MLKKHQLGWNAVGVLHPKTGIHAYFGECVFELFAMDHSLVLHNVFAGVFFLVLICILQIISKRWSSLPYTALLILAGFCAQALHGVTGLHFPLSLSPDFIYFVLLPLLLFESAYHISIHHFRLQFHTISALATFGLLISVGVVTLTLVLLSDMSLPNALLFGAIISSTDPIAVIALFKQLGAPRRLGLVADGESMLNDATSVIVFKVVAAVVLGSTSFSSNVLFQNVLTFLWVFLSSIVFGGVLGLLTSYIVANVRRNLLATNLLATSLALFSFVSAEHFAGLSGVIATVSFGVVFGNFAVPLFDHHQEAAFEHFWELVSLIALSLVFFCSSYSVEFSELTSSFVLWPAAIVAVLIGRAVSVYTVCGLCNRLPFFKYEPKIPLSWQHVLNWGGLRGVIPLVLAYSLPLDYELRGLLIALTIACFLFTLLVNGLTIKPLLLYLNLHRPARIEELYAAQGRLIAANTRKKKLAQFAKGTFPKGVVEAMERKLVEEERYCLLVLTSEQNYDELLRSFKMAGNMLEREATKDLFEHGYVHEEVMSAFHGQLNQQLDRIEYPELPHRSAKKDLSFDTSTTWRNRLAHFFGINPSNRWLFLLFGESKMHLVQTRYSLLQVRLMTSQRAVEYFAALREAVSANPLALKALDVIQSEQQNYIQKNRKEMILLRRAFPKIVQEGQQQVLEATLDDELHAAENVRGLAYSRDSLN